tara:strand:- start:5 stop:1744 length:1740 start_codon:yes stop_codon:yes gene_type:complete
MNKSQIIKNLIGDILEIKQQEDYLTVAKLKTVEIKGFKEEIDINTAIISDTLINKIKSSHVSPVVKSSSAYYDKDYVYKPSFWFFLSKSSGLRRAEPLVVSWCSGNHTILSIDQGFLSAFSLSPRLSDNEIFWDDLKKPVYNVVKNKLLSEYDYPTQTEAYVQIKKEYLTNYLSFRKKIAVQIFTIKKDILIDEEVSFLLQDNEYFIEEYKQFEIRISRFNHEQNKAHLEINGFKVLLDLNKNITEDEIIGGHYWQGIEGIVTSWRARHQMSFEYIFVSDEVLNKFEKDEDYEVHPQTGSVYYRNQWSVSNCERVGKNAIKIRIKKLYEGNSFEVINYWNKFSIHQSKIIQGESIVSKSEKLVKSFFFFGRVISNYSTTLFGLNFLPIDIITLNEERIEYTGWSDFKDYLPITHYVNYDSFSKEEFISRCKKLYILLVENLKEKSIRKIVDFLGFPNSKTKSFKSIKLLELVISYLKVISESGLRPLEDSSVIVERVLDKKDNYLLIEMSALNTIRQLDAHKTSRDSKVKLEKALLMFDINPNSITNNYSNACQQVYDSIYKMFNDLNNFFLSIHKDQV